MMWLLDMFFRRSERDVPETPEAPEVPDVSGEIKRATNAHNRATRRVVKAGVLAPEDARVKNAFEATGRAIRAARK